MTANLPAHALELRSLVTSQGTLELSLHDVQVPSAAADEVLETIRREGHSALVHTAAAQRRVAMS